MAYWIRALTELGGVCITIFARAAYEVRYCGCWARNDHLRGKLAFTILLLIVDRQSGVLGHRILVIADRSILSTLQLLVLMGPSYRKIRKVNILAIVVYDRVTILGTHGVSTLHFDF